MKLDFSQKYVVRPLTAGDVDKILALCAENEQYNRSILSFFRPGDWFGADMLLLESNHDVVMLKNGGYPYYLKQRILSEYGHLSNDAAAEFAIECVRAGTSDILLAHLSDENNSPQLAEYTVGRALQSSGLSVRLAAAPRDTISEVHVCRRSPSFASEN